MAAANHNDIVMEEIVFHGFILLVDDRGAYCSGRSFQPALRRSFMTQVLTSINGVLARILLLWLGTLHACFD